MSGENKELNEDDINALSGEDGILVGANGAAREMLLAVSQAFGEDVVLNSIAHFVLIQAKESEKQPRDHWNEFVTKLRDIYFASAEISNHG